MYDRYKSKKKNYGFLKFVLATAAVAAVVVGVYTNRHSLMIWKLSGSKLHNRINEAAATRDREKRLKALKDLRPVLVRHKEQNPLSPGAFSAAGELHFRVGEARMPGSFAELCISDTVNVLGRNSRRDFTRAIRNFRKAQALQEGDVLEQRHAFMLARSCYYTSFIPPQKILEELEKAIGQRGPADAEERMTLAVLLVSTGKVDAGLALMAPVDKGKEARNQKLFRATLERIGKKYTAAIMTYKDVMASTDDPVVTRLVRHNLGKIYFNQGLYRESTEQFAAALAADDKDAAAKIWMGRNLAATGDRDRAKALWNEVLSADEKNREAKELLGAP